MLVNITSSLGTPGQFPVVGKLRALTVAELQDLGLNSIKAFTYYEDMVIHCIENHTQYIWREVLNSDTLAESLLEANFTYPNNSISQGIDYSNRTFNFFVYDPTKTTKLKNYTWVKYATDINGSNLRDTPNSTTLFIGFAFNKTSEIESENPNDYVWSSLLDTIGNSTDNYTWVKFADTDTGSGLSDSPVGKSYIGLAFNKGSDIESEDPTDYIWTKIDDNETSDGIPVGGTDVYIWVKYADDINGLNLSDSIIGKKFIGVAYNKTTPIESEVATDYTWGSIFESQPDVNGKFTWVKYADTPTSGISDNPINKRYIGFAFDKDTNEESTNYEDYQWSALSLSYDNDSDLIIPPLENKYTWLKYADDDEGTNISDSPIGRTHIGIAVNKTSSVESNNYEDYTWSLINSTITIEDSDGNNSYVWVKYSEFEDGTDLDDDSTKDYIGLAYNKDTNVASTIPSDYIWSLKNGVIEEPLKWTYYWIKFADSNIKPDGTIDGFSDSAVGKLFMGIAYDKETAVESNDPSDYVWNPLTGSQGVTGEDGLTYYTWTKYADTKTSSILYNQPNSRKYIGLAFMKSFEQESEDYRDYSWFLLEESNVNVIEEVEQNNIVRVIEVPSDELTSFDDVGIAEWINARDIIVEETEIVAIRVRNVLEDNFIPIGELDATKSLDLSIGNIEETSATANWDFNQDNAIVRYELFYKPTVGGVLVKINFYEETTSLLSNLSNNTEYEVYIKAYDTKGNSKMSNTVTFTTEETFVNLKPNINVLEVGNTFIELGWNIEDSFNVDRFELYDENNTLLGSYLVSNGLSATREGLLSNTSYSFYVKAFSGITESLASDLIEATTLGVLTTPTLTEVNTLDTSSLLNINVPPLELNSIQLFDLVYRKLGQDDWIQFVGDNLGTTPTLTPLEAATSYEVRVRSFGGVIYSEWSNTLLITTDFLVLETGVSVFVNSNFPISPADESAGLIGEVSVIGGVPNTKIAVNISFKSYYFNSQQYSSIVRFKDIGISYNNGNFVLKGVFDENGRFSRPFKFIPEFDYRHIIDANIVSSVNGILKQHASREFYKSSEL